MFWSSAFFLPLRDKAALKENLEEDKEDSVKTGILELLDSPKDLEDLLAPLEIKEASEDLTDPLALLTNMKDMKEIREVSVETEVDSVVSLALLDPKKEPGEALVDSTNPLALLKAAMVFLDTGTMETTMEMNSREASAAPKVAVKADSMDSASRAISFIE